MKGATVKGCKVEKMKKQKWYELSVTRTDGAIDELELKGELTRERVENATSKEQIKFFKQFGNCYCNKTSNGYELYSRCNNRTSESKYASQTESSVDSVMGSFGLDVLEMTAHCQKSFYGKARVVKYKGSTLGLISYDTLVCTVERDIKNHRAVIKINGWYSSTTCRHINDFVANFTRSGSRLSKKDIEKGKCIYVNNVSIEQ